MELLEKMDMKEFMKGMNGESEIRVVEFEDSFEIVFPK